MPTVSFIIPVLNEQAGIGSLLEALRARYPEAELIVVDGGSDDQTIASAMPWCDQLLLGTAGRATQMNLGGRVAHGEYLCFLHADSQPGCSAQQLSSYLDKAPDWGFCRVRLTGGKPVFRLIEYCMNLRSRVTRIGTGDQMLFLRRELFQQTGGFDDIPLMEDVAYCKRLRRTASPLLVTEPVVTSSRRWEEQGVCSTIMKMWTLRLAYFLGVSPRRLWRHYYAG